MFKRTLQEKLSYFATKMPIVGILGPRQSGKTTLTRMTFPEYHYISLEDIETRTRVTEDPKKFLHDYSEKKGLILDEIQNVPDLFSYLQTYVDINNKPGFFILTGSQNFLLNEKISQSLAGRIAILTLLPLSMQELNENAIQPKTLDQTLLTGGYPRLYSSHLQPDEWIPFYITTYLERDVRQIINVTNLGLFQNFVKLCAGRIGQVINETSLANDTGVSTNTIRAWLSVLEASYLIFFLRPYYKNVGKQVIKSPKLYFYDSGIACSLLGIKTTEQLSTHYLRGGLFEGFIISELMKNDYNHVQTPQMYFWRDKTGHEIDVLLESGTTLIPIEIKAAETVSPHFFSGLTYWQKLINGSDEHNVLIYGGSEKQSRTHGTVLSWRTFTHDVQKYDR